MNKSELVELMARDADISKAAAARALEAMQLHIKRTLKRGGVAVLLGFGTFRTVKRAARAGRNPRTGVTIKIKAQRVARFSPGKALKEAVK